MRDRAGRFHHHVWKESSRLISSCSQRVTEVSYLCAGYCDATLTEDVPGRFKCEVTIADLQAREKAVRVWGEQYGNWTPEEHDAFLAALD